MIRFYQPEALAQVVTHSSVLGPRHQRKCEKERRFNLWKIKIKGNVCEYEGWRDKKINFILSMEKVLANVKSGHIRSNNELQNNMVLEHISDMIQITFIS